MADPPVVMLMRYPVLSITLLLAALLLPAQVLAAGPAWSARGGAPVDISADGSSVLLDGESFALYDAKGTPVWRGFGGSFARSRGEISSPLAITADGMYSVLGSNQGLLYVDRTQRIFWQDSTYNPIEDLSLAPDENFVAAVAGGRVSVYTRGGDVLWRNGTYPDVQFVAISSGGLLTVAGGTETIHAFNQTGFELWNYTAPGIAGVRISPADSDIIAASDYSLLCLHPSGNLLWKNYTGDEIRDFAISGDGSSIAAGNQGGRLVLLDRNGKEVFTTRIGNWVNAVSLTRDGSLVAAGGTDRNVYLFDRAGTQIFSDTTGSIVSGVAISADGSGLAAGSNMVYYYNLRATPPSETPPAPPALITAAPAATVTTPAPAAGTTPVPTTAIAPEETPAPGAGSGSLAVLALAIVSLYGIIGRRI
jgi:WD40 repeat protein